MIKGFVAALALATATLASPAFAATSTTVVFPDATADVSYDFGRSTIPAGTFTDFLKFNFSLPGQVDVGLNYFRITANGITNLTANFGGQDIALAPLAPGSRFYVGSLPTTVAAGPQVLTVSGNSAGLRAAYAGTLSFSAVPEPAAWGLMMFGFGAVGTMMRRRGARRKTVAFA